MMKKTKLLKSILIPTLGISAIGSIAAISTSCGEKKPIVIHVTDVTLNKTAATLAVGDTVTLTATVSPEDATDKSATWTSSRPSVATVDNNGKITAVAKGTTTITVKTNDGDKTATCKVTVSETVIHVTDVTLNRTSISLDIGSAETLTATVSPKYATDKSVTWTSSDTNIASVDSNGKITAVAKGTATITVKTNDGDKTATCTVTVSETVIHVTGVTLNKSSTTLTVGGTEQLTATVSPEDATDRLVHWASLNTNVASVDSNGKITAVAKGTATITVKTNDGDKTATCEVTVIDSAIHVTDVTLNKTTATLAVGDTLTLTATVLPENATDKSVTWSSSDTNIATVDNNGKITAVAEGTAIIFVTTHDGGKTATCKVTVNETVIYVTGVTLDETSVSLDLVGTTKTLTATVSPEDATDKSVTWTSSDTNIASVDSNGKITAVAKGTATITVKTNDGDKTATCKVTVNDFIKIHIESGNNSSASKTDLVVVKGYTIGQIKSKFSPKPNPSFEVYKWIQVDESGGYISDIPDDYMFTTNTNLKVLFNRTGDPQSIVTQESNWGEITVKYKLLDNHECRLLTKYEGADSAYGYVSGKGTLKIPDHINYNGEPYFVKEIPSDWSDGENDITGLKFDNVKHLETICDKAFYHTCALDYYTFGHDGFNGYCEFPEGLTTIGDEAFCGTSFARDYITGYSFPSTLKSIGEMAFQKSPCIHNKSEDGSLHGTLIFRSEVAIGEDAFWNISDHNVKYVYAPSLVLARQIINTLEATGDFEMNVMEPKVITK